MYNDSEYLKLKNGNNKFIESEPDIVITFINIH